MRRRTRNWFIVAVALLAAPSAALGAGFDDPLSVDTSQQFGPPYDTNVQRQDTPNDPDYDSTERAAPTDQTTTNLFAERFDLFGFPSAVTRLSATYTDPGDPNLSKPQISGFNAAGAWKASRGVPSVNVAILDTGINWDSRGLRTQVALKRNELPAPRRADGSTNPAAGLGGYDLNANGRVDVDDFKDDERVGRTFAGLGVTGLDLIKAFSDGTDSDGNGYVDDIAGWDFFDDDNDPSDASSYFAAGNHGSGRTNEAVESGNDGQGSIGVCPKCTFVPLRIWDTFVSDQNSFAMGVVYAADNGVEVIEGADGGLYHSAFAQAASDYAYEKGVAQLYSGDDLNTGNHNFPAAYDHVQLIQGTVADVKGLGTELPASPDGDPGVRGGIVALFNQIKAATIQAAGVSVGSNVPVRTYFRGANTTQFGGKSSISMEGATGSANTGKAAGAAALLIAAAREHGTTLSPDETRELLEQTAEDVLPGNTAGAGTADPAQVGFDTHFGYGRVDLGAAVGAAIAPGAGGNLPPEASLGVPGTPDWYAPVTGDTLEVGGLARDKRRSGQFSWRLEYGVGLAPTAYVQAAAGTSDQEVTGFGTIDLAAVRAALASPTNLRTDKNDPGGPVLDPTATTPDGRTTDPYDGQFTVRLVVTSSKSGALVGMDRKVLTALEDDTLRPGFPKRLEAGGEAPLRYSDLDGDNVQELVLPTEDGVVHAYRKDGSELPGWPVRTRTQFVALAHGGSPALGVLEAPREVPRAPVVGDITGDGRPEVITTAGERIYAWRADGSSLPGFPVNPDPARANCAPSEQLKRDDLKHPKCGFLAAPALAQLDAAPAAKSIVAPGLDGRLRAYRTDGTVQPGFPVQLIDPGVPEAEQMTAESINSPAVGDLDGDGRDEIVAAGNEVYGGGSSGGDVSFGAALAGAGTTSRVYAVQHDGTQAAGGPFLPGWPIELGGIIQNVLPLIGPGHDPSLVKVGSEQRVVVSTTGGSLSLFKVDGTLDKEMQQQASSSDGALNLFESAAVGNIDGIGSPEIVKYQIGLGQAANLLLVGQNVPYSHRIGAYDPTTGATKAPFPVITDDYQFLSSSTVAKVASGTSNQVLAGTGLGLLHAYDGVTGRDAPGFPKVTGGWLFAPAAVSTDDRLAAITREGYLYEYDVPGSEPCQPEWPSFRHDEQGTGNYDTDGTPPGAPTELTVTDVGDGTHRVRFSSPGDDGLCGTATRYVADVDGTALDLGAPVAGGSAYSREVTLPPGATLTVRAADGPAGGPVNIGQPASATVPRPTSPSGGGGSGGGSSGNGSGGASGSGASGSGAGGDLSPQPGGATPGSGAQAPTPNAGICTSRRIIVVRLKKAIRRRGVRRISVSVSGRRTYKLRTPRTRVRISLKGLPKGRVRVILRVRGKDRKLRTDRRSFLACVPRARR